MIKRYIPIEAKRWILRLLRCCRPRPTELSEIARLRGFPRYKEGFTSLLGQEIKFVDACTLLAGYEEIFEKEIYQFRAETEHPYIIDCGANIGLSLIYFKMLFPGATVVAFEPDPSIYQVCKHNIESFHLTDVRLCQKAIWKNNGGTLFQVEGGFSGRIPKPNDHTHLISVETQRLRELLEQRVDFLKIDIEGAEYDVIKDCAQSLEQVRHIFVEYHSHVSEKQRLHEILSILAASGFRYHIHEAYTSQRPYVDRPLMLDMDLQLNIFGFRLGDPVKN